jgi:hypothetical protein
MRTASSRGSDLSIHGFASTLACASVAFFAVAIVGACSSDNLPAYRAVLLIPEVVTFPATFDQGAITEVVRVANGGNTTLEIVSVAVRGPAGVFAQEGLDGLRLEPGEETSVTITYTPQDGFGANGEISIVSNSENEGTTTIVRLETLEPETSVLVSPDPIDFGRVGARSTAVESVSLTNRSGIPVLISEILPLDLNAEFVVGEEFLRELPRTLEPRETWTVDVAYTPSNDDVARIPFQVEYRIEGVNRPRDQLVPMIANDSAVCMTVTHEGGYSFGQSLPTEVREEEFTISNCSSGDDVQRLSVSSVALLNSPEQRSSESFGLMNAPALPLDLGPGESATFSLTYAPNALDVVESAWLEVVSDDSAKSPLVIEISGIGSENACPVAVATCSVRGADGVATDELTAELYSRVECSADGSVDPDGTIVTYTWSVVTPDSSRATISSTDQPEVNLFLDAVGTYSISLDVEDNRGARACSVAAVSVDVDPGDDIAVEVFWNTPGDIDPFDTGEGSGTDVNLHFLHAGRGCWNDVPYDCHWQNPEPDWGVVGDDSDNPLLQSDDRDGWGPENITLNNPETAIYRVGVDYRDAWDFGPSNVTVRVFVGGSIRFERTRLAMTPDTFWEVADIEWPSGDVRYIDILHDDLRDARCD